MSVQPSFQLPASAYTDETTGRYIVTFRDEAVNEGLQKLERDFGVSKMPSAADFPESVMDMAQADTEGGGVFPSLGVAVVTLPPDAMSRVTMESATPDSSILAIEPERIFYALNDGLSLTYLAGYCDAVNNLYEKAAGATTGATGIAAEKYEDDAQSTWGLKATKAVSSPYSGKGIRVAVLDTGLDLNHPDFNGRDIVSKSFVPGQSVQDGNSHGTHCIGTACGYVDMNGRRYGIAYQSTIFAGKVLGNEGSGQSGWIIAGMEWAVAAKCHIISMSLGNPNPNPSVAYETIGRRSLEKGCLIVAASGNHRNDWRVRPPRTCGQPANSPSIMAVGAIDNSQYLAPFSAGSGSAEGAHVDIAGPGVDIYSSIPVDMGRYGTYSGTSMATPHVSGIGALWAEAYRSVGRELWQLIVSHSRRLPIPSEDVGAGLTQAPLK